MEESPRPQVNVPEKEATELAKRIRNKAPKGVGLSVSGYVNRNGLRALHVAIDMPKGEKYERYDIRYKAETDMDLLEKNALKRISAWKPKVSS